jgi:hypothetical protein
MISLNAIFNEDDGEGRRYWIQIAPGIGDFKNPTQCPRCILMQNESKD